jgi:CRISPR-associated protein Csd1
MILQALNEYYRRKMADPDAANHLPAYGFEEKEIPFVIELSREGRVVAVKDTRHQDGKRKIAGRFLVPKGVKRAYGIAANTLWDTAEYVLGIDTKGNPERARQEHAAFVEQIAKLTDDARADIGIIAVRAFLENDPADALQNDPVWEEVRVANPVLTFRLAEDTDLICQRPAVIAGLPPDDDAHGEREQVCLVTGEPDTVERLHSSIKGVWGAQSSGANIVSFNLAAFDSYGKKQGANAPVGKRSAFAYTTALNHLLARGSRQRMQVGDASTVFWAHEADAVEDAFARIFGGADDPEDTEAVRALLEAVEAGRFDGARGENYFYVLGLGPNAARISVRFWHAAPLHEIALRVRRWFEDIEMVHRPADPEFPSLFRLLTACAVQGKADNIPPNLGGEIMRAILSGGVFPATWLNVAVQRCRAEQDVTYLRAAAIKACLIRTNSQGLNRGELKPMLDLSNTNAGYRLGRLFAVLEKLQEEANPGLNATIRERYYGAASSSPIAVFTTLLRLKNHHMAKLENRGRVARFEKLIGEIVSPVVDFPAHLGLPDQGRFALGYYHQRQALFTKPDITNNTGEQK